MQSLQGNNWEQSKRFYLWDNRMKQFNELRSKIVEAWWDESTLKMIDSWMRWATNTEYTVRESEAEINEALRTMQGILETIVEENEKKQGSIPPTIS